MCLMAPWSHILSQSHSVRLVFTGHRKLLRTSLSRCSKNIISSEQPGLSAKVSRTLSAPCLNLPKGSFANCCCAWPNWSINLYRWTSSCNWLFINQKADFGTYNVTNDGPLVSWADITRQIFTLAGYTNLTVTNTTTAEYFAGKEGIALAHLAVIWVLRKFIKLGLVARIG